MLDGVVEYTAFVMVVGVIVHLIMHNYALASITAAALSALGNLIHETWVANFQVNPGWALPLSIIGFVLALPTSFLVGIPIYFWRQSRQRPPVVEQL